MRPVPFTEPSFESASLMKSMRVFCAEGGGVEAGDAVEALSAVPGSLAEGLEVEAVPAIPDAAGVEVPVAAELGTLFVEPVPDVAGSVGVGVSLAEEFAGGCDGGGRLDATAPYAEIFRE